MPQEVSRMFQNLLGVSKALYKFLGLFKRFYRAQKYFLHSTLHHLQCRCSTIFFMKTNQPTNQPISQQSELKKLQVGKASPELKNQVHTQFLTNGFKSTLYQQYRQGSCSMETDSDTFLGIICKIFYMFFKNVLAEVQYSKKKYLFLQAPNRR